MMGGDKTTGGALERDLRVLARFVRIYCRAQHGEVAREPLRMSTHDVRAIVGEELELCAECRKLLAHAFVKRSRCPMDPKPMCKKCPNHCYAPEYRRRIQEVMRYSGRQMLLKGRLDYLLHFLA